MSARGPSAGRRQAGHARSLCRRAPLVVVALVVVGLLAAPSGATGAAAAQQATTVELMRQPTWVRPGDPYDVEVRVTAPPAGAALDLVVHDRLESRREFRDTLGGELGGSELAVPAQPLTDLPAAPDGTVTVGFTPELGGAGLIAGVYPVEVRVLSADGDVLDSLVTYLSFLKRETPEWVVPLEAAVLVDIAAAPSLQPDGSRALPAGTLDRARDRVQVLSDTAGVPLTLAPRPETLEGLAEGGPAEAALVGQLGELVPGVPVLARPFVDVDLAALQRADLIAEANAQAEGGANVVRTRLGVEPAGGTWLSGPTLGAEAARLAVDLGIDRAVVPPSAVDLGGDDDDDGDEPVRVPAAPVRLGDGGPRTMVTDTALATHLTSDEGMVAAHRFIAELAIMWLEAPANQRGVVVHLPADADIDPDVVSVALGALADGQAVRAVPVDQIFRDVPPLEDGPTTLTVAPHDVAGDLRPVAPGLQSARSRVTGIGGLVGDPTVGALLEQSLLMSTGSGTPDGERRAYVERVDAALGSVSGAVTLPDEFRITLTSRSSSIPVTLTNLSDQELSVRVELDSNQLEFPEGDVLTPQLVPGTTRIDVPVRARTSGAFTLDVTVTSPDGTIVLDTSTFDVRSTAISGVGLVLSIGAGLFLAIWWARHWRSSRRSRHLVPASSGGTYESAGGDTAPSPAATSEPHYRPAHLARQRTRSS